MENEYIDIEFANINENKEYIDLINLVLNKCFEIKQIKGYICITLTDDENIRQINKQYRNIDKATDVLSFPILEKEEIQNINNITNDIVKQVMLGDIIISIPKVEEQAKEYGHGFKREFSYMLVHGFCHLIGFDHIVDEDKVIMRKEEENILSSLEIIK